MAEYYDYDREESIQLSLAESTLDEQLLALARAVDDTLRELSSVIDALVRGDVDKVKGMYARVRSYKDTAEKIKDDAMRYMAGLGVILYNLDIYRQMFLGLNQVAMNIDGVAYRAVLIAENGFGRLPDEIGSMLSSLVSMLHKEYDGLQTALRIISSNPSRSYQEASKALRVEEDIDNLYRKTVIVMYKVLRDNMILLLIIRDLIELLEDSADVIRSVAENARFLALYRASRR